MRMAPIFMFFQGNRMRQPNEKFEKLVLRRRRCRCRHRLREEFHESIDVDVDVVRSTSNDKYLTPNDKYLTPKYSAPNDKYCREPELSLLW